MLPLEGEVGKPEHFISTFQSCTDISILHFRLKEGEGGGANTNHPRVPQSCSISGIQSPPGSRTPLPLGIRFEFVPAAPPAGRKRGRGRASTRAAAARAASARGAWPQPGSREGRAALGSRPRGGQPARPRLRVARPPRRLGTRRDPRGSEAVGAASRAAAVRPGWARPCAGLATLLERSWSLAVPAHSVPHLCPVPHLVCLLPPYFPLRVYTSVSLPTSPLPVSAPHPLPHGLLSLSPKAAFV